MPLAPTYGGARPPGAVSKHKNAHAKEPSKPNSKQGHGAARHNSHNGNHDHDEDDDDDDDDEETTTDDSSDEEAAFEMDGQELWTQTFCATCDCLIEPGEGIAKASSNPDDSASPATHTTLKSRSATLTARGSNASEHAAQIADTAKAAGGSKDALKRTHSAGRLHAKAGGAPLGPHKRTGSAGSRLHALSELRPTTKLHDDKGKGKTVSRDGSASHNRKSPATSRPGSAASNRSHSSSGPSSFKSNEATAGVTGLTNADAPSRPRKRGFLGGLGLTPAALKQQEAELAAKRKAPTPLYCSERCRLIDERRSSGLGELTKYLSQPLVPPPNAVWAPPPPPTWTRSASVSSAPLAMIASTPESECLCPDCMDKYADGSSASGAAIPSGASDTATESSSGYIYARGAAQKPRTASGRLITPLGLHAPGAGVEGYFPQFAPNYVATGAGLNSPRMRPLDAAQAVEAARLGAVPPRTSSAASAGRASTSGTDGSVMSSESAGSLWEPRLKPRSNSGVRSANANAAAAGGKIQASEFATIGTSSGLSTSTATPAITPRQSMLVTVSALASPSSYTTARAAHRLSVPGFAPTHEVDEDTLHSSDSHAAASPIAARPQRASSSAKRSSLLMATSPLKLLDKASQHHAQPSVNVFNDHIGSPTSRGSLLSRSLASEHTLMGASSITLTHQPPPSTSASPYDRAHGKDAQTLEQALAHGNFDRRPTAMSHSLSDSNNRYDLGSRSADVDDGLSHVVGSLKLAQSRASGPPTNSDGRPTESRRLSLFGVAGAPARRNSNAVSIASSASGSTSSGWLRSLSSAWLNWRSTASPAPMQADSDVFHSTDDSEEWPSRGSGLASRRESTTSHSSSSQHRMPYAQKRASSLRDVSLASSLGPSSTLHPAEMSRKQSEDRSAGITPTQSLVAKPTIRRGRVPAYVREIGQGGIPGDSSSEARSDSTAADEPRQQSTRPRVDSLTRVTDVNLQRKVNKRRSRDISVLPPLLAPISRSGSSTNLYAQMPRSARAYSTGRAWTAANTPQMFVGSAGSSHQQPGAGTPMQPPVSPTLMRSPYNSSFALAQEAARATMSPSRPNSAAGYHSLPYTAGTSPRAKGLGWGAMTSIASPPASTDPASLHHPGHRQSISYGHAAAFANRQLLHQAHRAHPHQHSHNHAHAHAHGHHHHQHHHHASSSHHGHGHGHAGHGQHSSSVSNLQDVDGRGGERAPLGHLMTLGAPPNAIGQQQGITGRHSTMPAALHRSPTPSVPEDGGEMSSQDLTSGDFISRPNSALAGQQGRRYHRTSLMPPPRSRSSLGMHAVGQRIQPLTTAEAAPQVASAAEDYVEHEEPPRTWSYDQLSGLKTYPILQLPDRETHDVYDAAWGLDAGGLAKHLGQAPAPGVAPAQRGSRDAETLRRAPSSEGSSVQKGFQPHRKKLFYFDA